ncbi:uncharacterized protein LOC113227662 isoform X2 [Hyposmocoma kahamanoa]|uniref:uncharacterized protein LOC113227662 isoform X2 n=1 Tax=Hyposmocoma kahamanoa TaxID=1477025 RepID=UPI000E6D786A|nr:uncharacterized protein LOC113227662 isoform X2 [Hyposmocoma kahamanoa]
MLLKRNLLESLTIISSSGTLICIFLNYVTNISPFKGVWFLIYVLCLFFLAVLFSFKAIQWMIHLNKPITYDVDGLVRKYPYLGFLTEILPKRPKLEKVDPYKEYDTNELSVISTVLERKLVSSWYMPFVSQDIGFPFACKQMLDQMIGKSFQICSKIETKDVHVDICSILITHLKEYKKALKRHEKTQSNTIEYHYKKSHPIFTSADKKYTSADHCTKLLRVILKELIPWELWDTPHSELLVRVLAKKLDHFIENTLSNPIWLNDKLISLLENKINNTSTNVKDVDKPKEETNNSSKPVIKTEETNVEQEVQEIKTEVAEPMEIINDIDVPKVETTTIESALSTLITKSTAPILQRPINEMFDVSMNGEEVEEIVDGTELAKSEPVDIKTSPVMRQRRGRQGRNEVKIYDRIIEGSVKTWETDIDLQCISLGQDLLATLDGEITLSRLWGQEHDTDKNPPLWFGEEDSLEMELQDSKEPSPVKKELSPKPVELLKDLQTTVHQAKTKIGDLQDEAAGMMEGLLDFGIAGLKKGLRFTGLGDDNQEKSPSHFKEKDKSLDKVQERFQDANKNKPTLAEVEENAALIDQTEEVNSGNSMPHLVKQQRVASQDSVLQQRMASQESVASQPRPIVRDEFPPPPIPLSDSPEPEYEEAADLSTSIAKLRSLLQQRAETSPNRSEEVWWESAEETRGRTQHHRSSKPVDTATLADEYDMSTDRNTSPNQASNNMQRLDKLFHRTVTGVFNSLKTAVGAEGDEGGGDGGDQEWTYVCTSLELSVGGAVSRLVGSRRAFGHVDAALDSLRHIAPPPAPAQPPPEDFEEWCAALGLRWCACAEAGSAAGLCASHLAYRGATLLLADFAESLISQQLQGVGPWLRAQVFAAFEKMHDEDNSTAPTQLRDFDIDETCNVIMEKLANLPVPMQNIVGEETLSSSVRLIICSLSHQELNKELTCRLLDMATLHFHKAAGLRNPSFDTN